MACGFVLVGGESRRMGEDKARLVVEGRPMALHQAAKLEKVCGRAALVGKGEDPFPGSGFPFVNDGVAEPASLHGVAAALAWSTEELNLILAADIPRCPEEFLAALLALARTLGAPVVVPTSCGEMQTLCAVWRKGALVAVREAIAAGRLSVRRPIERLGGIVLSEQETAAMPGGGAESFLNVNRPEDYEELAREATPHPPGR